MNSIKHVGSTEKVKAPFDRVIFKETESTVGLSLYISKQVKSPNLGLDNLTVTHTCALTLLQK